MKIKLNGEAKEIQATTLGALMEELELTKKTVATALNSNFVPAEERDTCTLSEGDLIEIVEPIQGG